MSTPVVLQIVGGFLLFAAIFMPLEWLRPLRPPRPLRADWFLDAGYYALGCILGYGFNAVSVAALLLWRHATGLGGVAAIGRQPEWLQFLEILLLSDLLAYLSHRAMHRVPWLWRFHRLHHSAAHLDWLASARMHPVDKLLGDCVQFLPLLCLGFSGGPLLAYTVLLGLQNALNHANVDLDYGPLRWLIASPQFHHWHHCSDPAAHDRNFAPHLLVWDVLLGTVHLPARRVMPAAYGVEEGAPESFRRQMLAPFRRG